MRYRVLTIAREFGSGGGIIASIIAERIGWALLDAALIQQIAREAHVDPNVARRCDEKVDSWLHRLNKGAIVAGVLSAGAPIERRDLFDSEAMAKFSADLIEKACAAGNCIIVGRGAQCVLRRRPNVFHAFVYGSTKCRIDRLKPRCPGQSDLAGLMQSMDEQRARYIRQYFGQKWDDRCLYNLMICSDTGDEESARVILTAIGA